jgi:hypothetical protein
MRIRLAATIAACTLLAMTALASAQPRIGGGGSGGGGGVGGGGAAGGDSSGIIQGTTPALTMKILQEAGYQKLATTKEDPNVVLGEVNNVPVVVFHMNCQENIGCNRIQFAVFFGAQPSIDINYVNSFNASTCCMKVYLNTQQEFVVNYDMLFFGGSTQAAISEHGKWFAYLLKKLLEYQPAKQ